MIDLKTWAPVLLLVVAACGGEASKTGSSASPAGSAPPKSGDVKAADAPKGPPTKLVKKDTEEMLDKTFGLQRMKEPIDARVAEAEAKLGPPAKTDGGNGVWYMVGDGACYELKLGKKDGAYTTSATDKAKCGL